MWLEKPYPLSRLHTPSQQKQKMTEEVPPVLTARRNSPFFLAILFCLLQSSALALRALTKEKMLHSIFPSLLLWGMCKMRSSQYYTRSIPNSLCGLRADLGLTIYCILSRSAEKRIQEASAHHISWEFAISSSCRLGEKREDLDACLWLLPPWTL